MTHQEDGNIEDDLSSSRQEDDIVGAVEQLATLFLVFLFGLVRPLPFLKVMRRDSGLSGADSRVTVICWNLGNSCCCEL